jgi:hypothetical protein
LLLSRSHYNILEAMPGLCAGTGILPDFGVSGLQINSQQIQIAGG